MPTPEYMLAMKLLANRHDDPDGMARNRRDLYLLMRLTGLKTPDELAGLIRLCYPAVPGINARIAAKIDDIVRGYGSAGEPEAPTWNAGRGDPTL